MRDAHRWAAPIARVAVLTSAGSLLLPAMAWAALPGDPDASTRILIIVITSVIALLIGLLLYQFSQRSSRVRFAGAELEAEPRTPDERVVDPKTVMPVIMAQMEQLQAEPHQKERVARTVSDIVTKTIDSQVTKVKREVNQQYSQLLEEKRRNETILQRKYQDVLKEQKQTSSVLESIAEGLVVINNKGEVVMMNPAAEKLLAVNQQQRVGKPLLENLQEGQLVSLVQGQQENREIVLNAKQDSTKRVLRASNAVINDENGKTVGMVAVLSDVTKQRELDELKSEFVSKVSHELRTPIVAMQHALSLLTDQVAGPMNEEQIKFAELVQRNLQRLNTLINDVLDLSKLEARKMDLRRAAGPIGPVIDAVCDSLDAWAKTKALTLVRRVPDSLPQASLDQARITQVLTNLLGNAIKFTPNQGRITVEVQVRDKRELEVSVTDTGIGIAQEDLPKLFSKFQQVGERSSSDIGGTGLGLAISREIVELHGGRIWAESDGAKGARFAFTLPLIPPEPASS